MECGTGCKDLQCGISTQKQLKTEKAYRELTDEINSLICLSFCPPTIYTNKNKKMFAKPIDKLVRQG